jgi:hypothetical protein
MEREVIGFLEWPLLWIPFIHHSFTLCMALPISWIHIMKSKLNLQGGLLPIRETALEKEVTDQLLYLVTNLTHPTILPSSSLKCIRLPNPVLKNQRSKKKK